MQSLDLAALFQSPQQLIDWAKSHDPKAVAGEAYQARVCPIAHYVRDGIPDSAYAANGLTDQSVVVYRAIIVEGFDEEGHRLPVAEMTCPLWLFEIVTAVDIGREGAVGNKVTYGDLLACIDSVLIKYGIQYLEQRALSKSSTAV